MKKLILFINILIYIKIQNCIIRILILIKKNLFKNYNIANKKIIT